MKIQNTLIGLAPDSKERIDAKNIIKYSLLLDYELPETNTANKDLIPSILKATKKCCEKLFTQHNAYNFFGSCYSKIPPVDSLIYLDPYQEPNTKNAETYNSNFHNLLLTNSIMSCYHAMVTEYTKEQMVTSYIANGMKKNGVYSLIEKDALSLRKEILTLNNKKYASKASTNANKSSKASDFNKKFQARIKRAPEFTDFLYSKKDDSYEYPLQFVSICNNLCSANLSSLGGYFADKERLNSNEQLIRSITNFANNVMHIPYTDTLIGTPADTIYHYYICEKASNANLYYCLLKNIELTEKRTPYRFNSKDIYKTLALCKKLSNPFTRTHFLRFAFDHIDVKTNSYNDYWHFLSKDPSIIVSAIDEELMGFHFGKWLKQYKLFVNFFSSVVTPVYDWCFLSMFLESIENAHPDKSHQSHLEIGIKTLGKYIARNYKEILQPIFFKNSSKTMDGLDIISPKYIEPTIEHFLNQDISYISDLIYEDTNIELNLKPLSSLYENKKEIIREKTCCTFINSLT